MKILWTDSPLRATDCDNAANRGRARDAALAKEAPEEKTRSWRALRADSFASDCANCCGEELLIVLQLNNKWFCRVDFFRVLGFTMLFFTRIHDFAKAVQALEVDQWEAICFSLLCKAEKQNQRSAA